MANQAWKRFERKIADKLGTFRTPLSGGSSRHTRSDTLHSELYVEIKFTGKTQMAMKKIWLDDMMKFAKAENKFPMLVFGFAGDDKQWAVIPFEVIENMYPAVHEQNLREGQGEPLA